MDVGGDPARPRAQLGKRAHSLGKAGGRGRTGAVSLDHTTHALEERPQDGQVQPAAPLVRDHLEGQDEAPGARDALPRAQQGLENEALHAESGTPRPAEMDRAEVNELVESKEI